MPTTTISARSRVATGINVFTLPPERQTALLETLQAINREILLHKFPMNVSASFHRAVDAPVIINYNQYTDRESGQYLRTRAETAPLLKRTHELSDKHEIRWYQVADVVTADGVDDAIEISAASGAAAVIGIFTVDPARQKDLLALIGGYATALKEVGARGFRGLAVHRGYSAAHAASYEQWTSADAYRQAAEQAPVAAILKQIRDAAEDSLLHIYDVLSVTRFDLDR